MELLLLFGIAAIGGFWYLNHVLNTKAREKAEEQLRAEKQAPYKVEEPVNDVKTESAPVVQTQSVESLPTPKLETAPISPTAVAVEKETPVTGSDTPKVKKPRKPAIKKPVAAKTVARKTKPKSVKAKK